MIISVKSPRILKSLVTDVTSEEKKQRKDEILAKLRSIEHVERLNHKIKKQLDECLLDIKSKISILSSTQTEQEVKFESKEETQEIVRNIEQYVDKLEQTTYVTINDKIYLTKQYLNYSYDPSDPTTHSFVLSGSDGLISPVTVNQNEEPPHQSRDHRRDKMLKDHFRSRNYNRKKIRELYAKRKGDYNPK